MERLKTKEGYDTSASQWVLSTHKIFKWVQDFVENNIRKFLNNFFTASGVFFYTTQTSLKCTSAVKNVGKIDITIEAGAGINNDGNMVILASQVVNNDNAWPADDTYYCWLEHKLVDDTEVAYKVNRLPESYANIQTHLLDSYDVKIATAWPTGATLDKAIKICKIVVTDPTAVVTDERIAAGMYAMPPTAWSWVLNSYTEWPEPRIPANITLETSVEARTSSGPPMYTTDWLPEMAVDLSPSKATVLVTWGKKGSGIWAGDVFTPGEGGMTVNEYQPSGGFYYYLYYAGDQEYKKIESNTATTITVETGHGGTGSGDYEVGPVAHTYEVRSILYDRDDNAVSSTLGIRSIKPTGTKALGPTPQEFAIQHLPAGVKVAVQVRALMGPVVNDQASGWTTIETIVAGQADVLVMTEITADSVDQGVKVSWTDVPLAAGYRAVYTINGANPDRTNRTHRKTDAVATTSLVIPAGPGDIVRVGVWCYDQAGRMSDNVSNNDLVNGSTAGGVMAGEYAYELPLNNKSVTTAVTGSGGAGPGVGRYVGMARVAHTAYIKELVVVVEAIDLNGATQAVLRMFGQGAEGDAATITFSTLGAKPLPLDLVVDAGFIMFDAFDESNPSGNQPSYTVDIYVGYRFGEVRPTDDVDIVAKRRRGFREDF